MLTTLIFLMLCSSLLLSGNLTAASGGGLIADHSAGTQISLEGQMHAITGGIAQGTNLLHSFSEFNLEAGQTADFRADATTNNIISRVTGPNSSWINGKIQSTTRGASLYLMNPHGVVFGDQASLDVQGAFHVSTADYVRLADNQRIDTAVDQGVTLTVAAPEAFGFLDASVGGIQVEGSQLSVASGKTLSLIGGEITVTSGAELQTAAGQIDLVGVASAGEVQMISLGVTNPAMANITINGSRLSVDNVEHSTTVGRLSLRGGEVTAMNSHFNASNHSAHAPSGQALSIEATDITLAGDVAVVAGTLSAGQGGIVQLKASRDINISGENTRISSASYGSGDAGKVQIQAGSLTLTAGAQIASSSGFPHPVSDVPGTGQAGSLEIVTDEMIYLQGDSVLTTESDNAGGGRIHIETRDRLHLQDSRITTSVKGGDGDSGDIFIDPIFVILEDSQIQANAHGGSGGNINLIADYLLLSGPSVMEASSELSSSGEVNVRATVLYSGAPYVSARAAPLDAAQWQPVPCSQRTGRASRLIMAGYDAHPTPVDDVLSAVPLSVLRPLTLSYLLPGSSGRPAAPDRVTHTTDRLPVP